MPTVTMTSIAFHGAAGTVTGSRFLLESGETSVLVDCGQFQGLKPLRLRNWDKPPFNPGELNAVLLTHAHIDHSGMLPRLVKEGFRGPIYTTPATADLARILLLDAARIQEEDAEYANRKGYSKHHPALPLFTVTDAERTLKRFEDVPYGRRLALPDMQCTFHNAGHILGSAHVEVRLPQDRHTVVFSGDLGRYGAPLHRDPDPLPACDTLVLESTYGDREHQNEHLDQQLVNALTETLHRGGTVLIPSFAVARAQLVTMLIGRLIGEGRLPRVPIHMDSPMAVDVTDVYRQYANEIHLDEDVTGARGGPLVPSMLTFHRSVEESRRLNDLKGPRIIISSSGMLTGGRVLHHLRRLAGNQANLILLVGYQAAGTRGRALLQGARSIRIHGGNVDISCQVRSLDGFSAHADRNELARWVQTAPAKPGTIFLVHGEPDASKALGERLAGSAGAVTVPGLGQRFLLNGGRSWRLD
ncbi:MAG: MBL fold metallo-hydrolase [Dehalococcoidia bacterium]|nr:MBL fold metallo-hydrolase [Dehalococcoidia bacterium]MCB9484539.1 MBL fold metallo-hydrolase [Thermoflexaceae bacterium]